MGKLEKMTIQAYEDPKFSQKFGEPFKVMINPEKYSRTFAIEYNEQQAMGTSGGGAAYSKSLPESIKLEFIFDGTGAIPDPMGGDVKTVDQWLKDFKEVAFDYNGEIHSSNYLMISWGSLIFKCRLQQFTVDYTLFKEDGTPLRAKVSGDFKEFTDPETVCKESSNSSPDLSHVHTFIAGDSLVMMCHKIYKDPQMYLEVARQNKIMNFRNIEPGTKVFFPPIKK
ncbi:MAG: LysM peptidoglycan-binding domain-containing protein [Reichenbachiella sp.]|uniref:CIS tube protein n=1 Tax=Reichenbachiella sp. TaxID=2184521 RepID=UPI0032676E50